MKKLIFIVLILILLGAVTFYFLASEELLSPSQAEIRKMFGLPHQFVVTYLPRGSADKPQLARSEIWFYPEHGKKITFLAGELVSDEEYLSEDEVTPTTLRPEDFDFNMNYDDVVAFLGSANIEAIDFLPVFHQESVETYASDQAIFVIEDNYLTYIQTLSAGMAEEFEEELIGEEPTLMPETTLLEDLKTYTSSDLGFEIKYPGDWFLSYGVLTSYDPDYLIKGLNLPEKRIKCDFLNYDPGDVEITNEEIILDNEIKAYQGQGEDRSGEEGPGLGKAVFFLIKDEKHAPIGLLCFAYDESFKERLIELLKTFKFL